MSPADAPLVHAPPARRLGAAPTWSRRGSLPVGCDGQRAGSNTNVHAAAGAVGRRAHKPARPHALGRAAADGRPARGAARQPPTR